MFTKLTDRATPAASTTLIIRGVTFFLAGYFILHALGVGGHHGYSSLARLDAEIAEAEAERAALGRKKAQLAHKVGLLSGEVIDGDLLGELARSRAGLFAPDEVIINTD